MNCGKSLEGEMRDDMVIFLKKKIPLAAKSGENELKSQKIVIEDNWMRQQQSPQIIEFL